MKYIKTITAALCLSALFSCSGENQTQQETMESKNQVIETIMARRSIRQYKAEPVNRATLDTILRCGINAPNGMNKQSWELRIIDNPETFKKFVDLMATENNSDNRAAVEGCFRGAPTLIFIANDRGYDCSPIDCGLLSQNIMLSAWSLNVGSICLGSPIRLLKNSQGALEMLGFSEGYNPIICIGLGYSLENPDAKPRDMGKIKFIE